MPHRNDRSKLNALTFVSVYLKKNYSPRGRGARPYEQWSEDLSQCVCVQSIAGLHLGDLGQVCEEVLQGETVMERDGGGALEDQAYFSVMATSYSTVWNSDSNTHEEDLFTKLLCVCLNSKLYNFIRFCHMRI